MFHPERPGADTARTQFVAGLPCAHDVGEAVGNVGGELDDRLRQLETHRMIVDGFDRVGINGSQVRPAGEPDAGSSNRRNV